MTFFDNLRWQSDRQWQQVRETLEYTFLQLFRQQTEPFWQDSPSLEAWLRWFLQGVLLMGLGGGLYFLGRSLWRWWQRRSRSSSPTALSTLGERPRPVREWLELAQNLEWAGDYRGACRALYMALLYRLQAAGWLRLQTHWTNDDYLRELQRLFQLGERSPTVGRSIQHLFQVHSRTYYGAEPVDAQTLASCQAAYFEVEPFLQETQQ
ncbi:DUF4129 domain-containing protein [Thermosynechococcus vestitus]|uniref:Tlr1527 protein n=1 Tax=Thermosynechococcus vestitus (strain NIES-2133 / IAM M-273 / BP-1) TaxID=197221 RepID=Q8DIQ4_THEVB|nr:DUF4129 domain-containing protein [Thermosynechococcus vestitus]BAC09079.1 tlr1527 [Thermosynechococcus vestitus BP-1]